MKFPFALRSLVSVAVLAAMAPSAHALGLGAIQVKSSVGQPLVAEVELLTADAAELDSVRVLPAGPADYERQGVAFSQALGTVKVEINRKGARPVAVATTSTPVADGYLHLILEGITSTGRVRRTYALAIPAGAPGGSGRLPGESASYNDLMRTSIPKLPPVAGAAGPAVAPAMSREVVPSVEPQTVRAAPAAERFVNIVELGESSPATRIPGSESNVPLAVALKTIVPKGWRGYAADEGVKRPVVVSWPAGRTWVQALDSVLGDAKLVASLNWDKQEVTFRSANERTTPASVAVAPERPVAQPVSQAPSRSASREGVDSDVVAARAEAARLAAEVARLREAKDAAVSSGQSSAQIALQQAKEVERLTKQLKAVEAARAGRSQEDAARLEASLAEARAAAARQEAEVQRLRKEAQDSTEAAARAAEEAKRQATDAESLRMQLAARQSEVADIRKQLEVKGQASGALAATAKERDALRQRLEAAEAQLLMAAQALAARVPVPESRAARDEADTQARRAAELDRQVVALRSEVAALRRPGAAVATATTVPVAVAAPAPRSAAARVLEMGGKRPADLPAVRSAGLNVGLASALQQIVPPGFMVTTKVEGAPKTLSWRGNGRDWPVVLDEALSAAGLRARVDFDASEITISPL